MTLENPFRSGTHYFPVETLMEMGVNKAHKFSAFAEGHIDPALHRSESKVLSAGSITIPPQLTSDPFQ
jgi:hypothetical protein